MRKKKLYLSRVHPSNGAPLAKFIPALLAEVVHTAITKFELPGESAEGPLIKLFQEYFVAGDTPIRPMSSKPQDLIDLINAQNRIGLTGEEVDMCGIDVGGQSVTWLTPRGRVYGLCGNAAVEYRNASWAPLQMFGEVEFAIPVERRYALYRSLMNALATLKAYVPSTPQETLT